MKHKKHEHTWKFNIVKDETNLLQIYILGISELRCTEIGHFEYHPKEKSQSISMMWSWTYTYHSRISEITLKPWTSLVERNCKWNVILYFSTVLSWVFPILFLCYTYLLKFIYLQYWLTNIHKVHKYAFSISSRLDLQC